MNREDIIRMAVEAGDADRIDPFTKDGDWVILTPDELERFATLVASAERQRINDEAKAHLQELRNNFDVESAELRLHMWSQEKQA